MLLARASLQSEGNTQRRDPNYVERYAACTDSQSQLEEAHRRNEHISSPDLRLVGAE